MGEILDNIRMAAEGHPVSFVEENRIHIPKAPKTDSVSFEKEGMLLLEKLMDGVTDNEKRQAKRFVFRFLCWAGDNSLIMDFDTKTLLKLFG